MSLWLYSARYCRRTGYYRHIGAADASDLEEVTHTERHLLYVARTRGRDQLLVTSVAPASLFLDDMKL